MDNPTLLIGLHWAPIARYEMLHFLLHFPDRCPLCRPVPLGSSRFRRLDVRFLTMAVAAVVVESVCGRGD